MHARSRIQEQEVEEQTGWKGEQKSFGGRIQGQAQGESRRQGNLQEDLSRRIDTVWEAKRADDYPGMYTTQMPPNPRKRAAASPAPMQYAPSQDYLPYRNGGGIENMGYSDPALNFNGSYNGNVVAGMGTSQPQYEAAIPAPNTQLTRRPMRNGGGQMVRNGESTRFEDPWGQFGDESILDPNMKVEEQDDDVELLEEKAVVAKREAQAKRKQIPPFVQKLSR